MFHFGAEPETAPVRGTATDRQFIEREIAAFRASARLREMRTSCRYFEGWHDILTRRRTAIGADGTLMEVKNLPNARIVDNQFRKMVKQKANYLLGQPIAFRTEDERFARELDSLLGAGFDRLMKAMAEDALKEGIAWLHPTIEEGQLVFKRLPGHEVIPGWRDAEHTALDYAIRVYPVISYEKSGQRIVEKCEVFDESGIWYFELEGGHLRPEAPWHAPYFTDGENGYNWERLPLIAFKRDSDELPLIRAVKSLQDGLNSILSNFENNMEEDARNTILILVNYDGENLGEFRRNLAAYGAVKVKTVDGAAGDLKTLTVEVNGENYQKIIEIFKKAIVENAMGFDAKDDRLTGAPNQMNILSMYSDIELDANDMEMEFQAALEQVLWFVRCHLANTGAGDFMKTPVEVIFNRDLPMVESEVITNIRNSVGILSDETLVAQHPWVDDVQGELKRIRAERAEPEDLKP